MVKVSMEKLLATVIQLKASDLHISVGQPPVVRHQGRMKKLDLGGLILDSDDTTSLMKSITPDRCQQELQAKGGADFAIEYIDGFRFRVAVFKQKGTIGMVMRRIPSQFLTFEQLRTPEAIRSLIIRPRGLFLVTGPTGSGKTTSLSSMINFLNDNYDRHIITLEDPIEYYHKHNKCTVNQREINVDVPDFKEGHSPRPCVWTPTSSSWVKCATCRNDSRGASKRPKPGHLVFGTLHTSGAASTVDRVVTVFPENEQDQIRTQLAGSLIGVLSQALLPKKPEGLIAAYEMMVVTPAIKNLIRENKTYRIDSSVQTGRKHGMFLLDDHLFRLWREDLIDKEEALLKSNKPGDLAAKIAQAERGLEDDEDGDGDEDDEDEDEDEDDDDE